MIEDSCKVYKVARFPFTDNCFLCMESNLSISKIQAIKSIRDEEMAYLLRAFASLQKTRLGSQLPPVPCNLISFSGFHRH